MPRKSLSPTFNAYSPMNLAENTSKYAVEEELRDHGLSLPPSRTKKQEIAKLRRYGIPIPQMTEEDAQCAARFPQFAAMDKEDIMDLAEIFGIDTTGMAKIDACHALHVKGVDTEHDHTNNILTVYGPTTFEYEMKKTTPFDTAPANWDTTNVTRNFPNFSNSWPTVNWSAPATTAATPPAVNPSAPVLTKPELNRAATAGKKCRRSKVDGRKRDKKGRFCKKSKKMMKRK